MVTFPVREAVAIIQLAWIVVVPGPIRSRFQASWIIATASLTGYVTIWWMDNAALIKPITAQIWSLEFLSKSPVLLENVVNCFLKTMTFKFILGFQCIHCRE